MHGGGHMESTNMLIIMADQHNPKMLGCRGHEVIKTPYLDALAKRGSIYTNAYTNSPLCVPARACFATGRYVHENKCWDNALAYGGDPASWGHRLQENGHSVVSIGKLHYRSEREQTGFDQQIIPMHITDGVGDLHGSIRPNLPIRYQGRQYVEQVGPGETKYTEYDRAITQNACDWLLKKTNTKTSKPWVLFVSLICPHFPIIAPHKFYDLYPLEILPGFKQADERLFASHPWWKAFNDSFIYEKFFKDDEHRKITLASYLGLCSFTDNNVGKIIDALNISGLEKNTRVVYTSDHGDNMGARGLWGKSTWHDESAGIPLIISGPDIPKGQELKTPVSLVDMYQTILNGVGLDPCEDDMDLPGCSLIELAIKGDEKERTVFGEYHGAGAISAAYMLRTSKYKYIHYAEGFEPELYDLINDPEEMENLAPNHRYKNTITEMQLLLYSIVDPDKINEQALSDQKSLIEKHGGREHIIARGAANNTPVPGEAAELLKK